MYLIQLLEREGRPLMQNGRVVIGLKLWPPNTSQLVAIKGLKTKTVVRIAMNASGKRQR